MLNKVLWDKPTSNTTSLDVSGVPDAWLYLELVS